MSYETLQPTDGTFKIYESSTASTVLQADSDSKVSVMKVATLARTDTAAKNLFVLPIGAIPLRVTIISPVASDATSSATISIGKTGTGTFYVNAQDVKTAAGQIPCAGALNLGAVASATATTQINAIYAETGTASTTGGPFTIVMSYYVA